MRSFRTSIGAAVLISSVVLATSHSAKSGEKRGRTISTCSQPAPVACAISTSQPAAPTQTCCQPAIASVQPRIELVAYTRPASPRRLTPQPDALDIRRTTTATACAAYMVGEFGGIQMYYGTRCSDNQPIVIYANNLAPLPGLCENPNGACITSGSAVIPTAFNKKTSANGGSVIQNSARLNQKRKAGEEPRNPVDAQAIGPHALKERTRVGQPIYIKFAQPEGVSGFVVVELQRYFVKGTGKASQELSGTIAVGLEVDAAPVEKAAKEIDRQQIQVVADHVALLEIGDVTYDIVTATKLVP